MENLEQITNIYQRPINPIEPILPKKNWKKFAIRISLFLILCIGIFFIYKYRYEIFESSWRHSINAIEEKYNTDSLIFEKTFEEINNVNFLQSSSSSQSMSNEYVEKVNNSIIILNNVIVDIDKALEHTSIDSKSLSAEDSVANDLYKTCYEGRKQGAVLALEAMQNTSKYVQAYTSMQIYNTYDLKKFQDSFSVVSRSMQNRNIVDLSKNIAIAKADILVAKSHMDNAANLLGYNSHKQISVAFQLLYDGLVDVENSIPSQDLSLVLKGGEKWQKAGDLFTQFRDQTVLDLKIWMDTEVIPKYQKQNDNSAKIDLVCVEARKASMLDRENTPANKFIKKVKDVLHLSF